MRNTLNTSIHSNREAIAIDFTLPPLSIPGVIFLRTRFKTCRNGLGEPGISGNGGGRSSKKVEYKGMLQGTF